VKSVWITTRAALRLGRSARHEVERYADGQSSKSIRAPSAVVLDEDLLANLDARAERHNTDRAGYLRWILTGKAPEETPAKPRRKKP
jgi:hypothetical protein